MAIHLQSTWLRSQLQLAYSIISEILSKDTNMANQFHTEPIKPDMTSIFDRSSHQRNIIKRITICKCTLHEAVFKKTTVIMIICPMNEIEWKRIVTQKWFPIRGKEKRENERDAVTWQTARSEMVGKWANRHCQTGWYCMQWPQIRCSNH